MSALVETWKRRLWLSLYDFIERERERERERDEFRGVQDAGEFWEDRFLGSFCWLYELFLLRR